MVVLNTRQMGEYFIVVSREKGVFFPAAEYAETGLKAPQGSGVVIEGQEYVRLDAMGPALKYIIDEKSATLSITAEPGLFRKNSLDLSYSAPSAAELSQRDSGFINYSLGYGLDDNLDFNFFSLPFEAGANIGGLLFLSNFSYFKSTAEEKFVRLFTNVTKDDVSRQIRFIAGDFTALSGAFGGGGTFGGISLSRNFSMTPNFIKSQGLDVSGVLTKQSDVEIYVDGNLVRSESLGPGEFELLNVPNATGSGTATIVLRDAFGKVEQVVPYYLSTDILKPGVSEFSYNLGFRREGLGDESLEYGDIAFTGFHRVGLTRYLTAEMRLDADKRSFNAGPAFRVLLGRAGEVAASAAYSMEDGRDGLGASVDYRFTGKSANLRLSARGFSRDYSNIALPSSQDKPRGEYSVGLGYNMSALGSLFASYTRTDNHIAHDMSRESVFYSKRLFRELSLFVSASRTHGTSTVDEFFAGLNMPLGEAVSGSLNYQSTDGRASGFVSVQKNAPIGTGLGYRLAAEMVDADDGTDTNWNGFLQYNGSHAVYSAEYRRGAGLNSYTFNISSGVAFIGGSAYLTRPIADSFALVDVGNVENVKVYYSNQYAGETDRNGEVLIPAMISYYDNFISIDDTDIPVNYSIPEVSKYVSTPYRGSALVKFDAAKVQGFDGRFFLVEGGIRTPAEYAGIEIQTDRLIEAVVGKGGDFYLENLPTGTFPARLFMKDKECRFDVVIPERDDMIVDMGDIACEIH